MRNGLVIHVRSAIPSCNHPNSRGSFRCPYRSLSSGPSLFSISLLMSDHHVTSRSARLGNAVAGANRSSSSFLSRPRWMASKERKRGRKSLRMRADTHTCVLLRNRLSTSEVYAVCDKSEYRARNARTTSTEPSMKMLRDPTETVSFSSPLPTRGGFALVKYLPRRSAWKIGALYLPLTKAARDEAARAFSRLLQRVWTQLLAAVLIQRQISHRSIKWPFSRIWKIRRSQRGVYEIRENGRRHGEKRTEELISFFIFFFYIRYFNVNTYQSRRYSRQSVRVVFSWIEERKNWKRESSFSDTRGSASSAAFMDRTFRFGLPLAYVTSSRGMRDHSRLSSFGVPRATSSRGT